MLKSLRTQILRLFRRTLGTAQVLEQQQLFDWRNDQRHDRQMQMLLKLGNAAAYAREDAEALKSTPIYRRCAEIISLLKPMDVDGGTFVRVGKDHDGGYIMVDVLRPDSVDAAYGFGISGDTSWDEAIAGRGIDVFMFDHTMKALPTGLPRCHAFPIGVTGHLKGPSLKTLGELVAMHGHSSSRKLVMKMDVEGCEWDVFDAAPSDLIDQFSQIVVEFHRLTDVVQREESMIEVVRVLTRLNRTHQCVHVHANVAKLPLWVGPLVLPDTLEVTYVRRADWEGRLSPCTRQFPTTLDEPSNPGWPDLHLGRFTVPS